MRRGHLGLKSAAPSSRRTAALGRENQFHPIATAAPRPTRRARATRGTPARRREGLTYSRRIAFERLEDRVLLTLVPVDIHLGPEINAQLNFTQKCLEVMGAVIGAVEPIGWHLDMPQINVPTFDGKISGFVNKDGGKITDVSLGVDLSGGVSVSVAGGFGVPNFADIGVKGTYGLNVEKLHVDITGKPDNLRYSGDFDVSGSLQLGPYIVAVGLEVEAHLTGKIGSRMQISSSGQATGVVYVGGSCGASVSFMGVPVLPPVGAPPMEVDLGSAPVSKYNVNLVPFWEMAKQSVGGAAASVNSEIVAAAAADHMVVTTQPPDTVVAGQGFSVVVAAADPWGYIDTSFNGSVSIHDADGAADFGGVTTVSAVNGVATFTGLTYTHASDYHVLHAESSVGSVATDYFLVIPAPATQLVFSQTPWWVESGSWLSVTIDACDPYGNLDKNFAGNVTVALADDPIGATLTGTTTVAADRGQVYFGNLTLTALPGDYFLEASGSSLTGAMNPGNPIEVLPDDFVATHLVVTTPPPGTVVAGSPFNLVVAAVDNAGNIDTSFQSSVGLYDNTGAVDFGDPRRVKAVNGVATFTGLTYTRTTSAGNDRVLLATSGVGNVFTEGFPVIAAPATQLGFEEFPSPWNQVVSGSPFAVVVGAYDRYGNLDTSYGGNVTAGLADDSSDATLGGTVTVAAAGGHATFSDLTLDLAGYHHLAATAPGLSGAAMQDYDYVWVVAGAASRLVISPPASGIAMGKPFDLEVRASDAAGNTVDSYDGEVALSLGTNPTGAALGGTLRKPLIWGVASFTGLTIDKAGSGYTFQATCPGLPTQIGAPFDVAASRLVVPQPSASIATGAPFAMLVSVRDASGAVDPDFNGKVTLALKANPTGAHLRGNLTVNAVKGIATFTGLSIDKQGSGYTLEATSPLLAASTGPVFDVTNKVLTVAAEPPVAVTAGRPFGVVVKAVDRTGKVDTSFNGMVTLTDPASKETLGGTTTVTAVKGVATFSGLRLDQASVGHWLVAASNSMPSVRSRLFDVVPAAANGLAWVSPPADKISTNAPFEVRVSAVDSLGNVQTDFNGTVTVALADNPTGATLGGTLTAAAVNGVATFPNLAVNKDGSRYTLRATATGLSAVTSSAFDVTPAGAATQLVVTTQPSTVAAGSSFGLVISAVDGFGTVDATFNGDVTLTAPSSTNLGGTLTVTAVGGVATFTGLSINRAGSDITLAASSTDLEPATTDAFTVTALAATQLRAWGPFGNVFDGSDFAMTVRGEDQYGNVDPNFSGNVTLAWGNNPGGATLSGELTVAAIDGRARFSGLAIDRLGSDYTLAAQSTGMASGTSAPFDVTTNELVAAPEPPACVPVGAAFGFAATARNASGGIDASFGGTVTVSLVDYGETGATLAGTLTASATGGVAAFSGLTLDKAGEYALLVTGDGVGGSVTRHFAVIPGIEVDTTPPTSSVTALPAYERSKSFTVTWSGSDNAGGAGVASYDVYVSDNGGAFTAWKTHTTKTSAKFTGKDGHTYGFYSTATDKASNVEPPPADPDATTRVDVVRPTSKVTALPAYENSLTFDVNWSGSDGAQGSGVATYSVYVWDNGRKSEWLSNVTQTSAPFTGLDGHRYAFASVATDNAGNVQAAPKKAQTTTRVDVTPPASSVKLLPAVEQSTTFTVKWSGSDGKNASGIANYTLYYSDNGGEFVPYAGATNTTKTSASFVGLNGHTYGFYTVATDKAGNIEAPPATADTTTQIVVPGLSIAATRNAAAATASNQATLAAAADAAFSSARRQRQATPSDGLFASVDDWLRE